MRTFKIDNFTIRVFDKYQWILEEKRPIDINHHNVGKSGSTGLVDSERVYTVGYYTTLRGAKVGLMRVLEKRVDDFDELCKWVVEINKIKVLSDDVIKKYE